MMIIVLINLYNIIDKKKISLATFVIENINFSETSVQILSLISKIESLSEKK